MNISNKQDSNKPYIIVAIGASAGGLNAITELLEHLPENTGMAFFYIQHLDRDHESNLAVILEKHSRMKVVTAADMMPIEPNHVFVIPPNKEMILIDGVMKLEPRPIDRQINLPIDRFFFSLAEKQKESSIGIVLSGAASDGALGLKAIKMVGGLTFAQDETAQFQSMPKAAIAEGAVDMVLAPKDISKELIRISSQHNLFKKTKLVYKEEDVEEEIEEIQKVLAIILKKTSVDFAHYKVNTIRRRIFRRMLLNKIETIIEYIAFLKKNTTEVDLLYKDLLINVTTFFRETNTIDYLQQNLLPKLLKGKERKSPLRIWIPACATGEEAYSLAIIIFEILGKSELHTEVKIFATDLSESSIAKARHGVYTLNDVANISDERLNRFFTKVDGSYRINKIIRDLCVFAQHNVLKDPPFSKIDIISCCNLLIYLNESLQRRLLHIFHYALKEDGKLILGKSETVGKAVSYFTLMERKLKIFTKNNVGGTDHLQSLSVSNSNETDKKTQIGQNDYHDGAGSLERIIDHIFLNQHVPASVIINYNLDILQFRGPTHLFLQPVAGTASLNLLKMLPSTVSFQLKAIIQECINTGQTINKSGLEIKKNESVQFISIKVSPLHIRSYEPMILLIFEEGLSLTKVEVDEVTDNHRIKQYENELIALREEIRMLHEQYEAGEEELKSANEEIVSSNEELQTMISEMETTKEELESSNEELITTNQELIARNDQLNEAQQYSEAVFTTIRESLLILDKDLRVKGANATFYKTFQVKEFETEGMLLYDLGNRQWNIPRLRTLLEEIIPKNNFFTDYEVTHTFEHIGEKVMVLNARKLVQKNNMNELVLLAIEDITKHAQAQKVLSDQRTWLRNMTESVPAMIWVADTNKQFTYLNKTWLAFTGKTLEEELNNGWLENIHKEDVGNFLELYKQAFDNRKPFVIEFRMRRFDGMYLWVLCSAVPTLTLDNTFNGFTGSCTEIHDKRVMNEELEQRVKERTKELQEAIVSLQSSNHELEQYAYVASHDLQEPLRKILTFSDRLENQFIDQLQETGKTYVRKIIESSQRMTQLIDDLLNFSRITQISKGFVPIDLNTVIANVLPDFDLIIKEKNAQISISNLPFIQGNRIQLQQLFHNLISNSLKFSKKDTPPILQITANPLSEEELNKYEQLNKALTYHQIIVKDNGIGFDQQYADQIFIIFHRLNDRASYSGTGIGLSLCSKIVENHKGLIKVQSEENVGTTFYIILPENLDN